LVQQFAATADFADFADCVVGAWQGHVEARVVAPGGKKEPRIPRISAKFCFSMVAAGSA
jgi:hypothetical protein